MTERFLEAYINLCRERLRKEDLDESTITGFSNGDLAGALQQAIDRLSQRVPYRDTVTIRPALAADADYVVDAEDISGWTGAPDSATVANSPDKPRNVTFLITDGDTSITAFTITVTGTDKNDDALTETFEFADGLSQTGTEEFKTVTSVTCSAITGAGSGDTLDIGIGTSVLETRELDLSNIPVLDALDNLFDVPYELIDVEKAEWLLWQDPEDFRRVEWLSGKILRLKTATAPSYDDNIRLFYTCKHRLNSTESTIPANLEGTVVAGGCYYALISLGQSMDNRVTLGVGAADKIKVSSQILLKEFEEGMRSPRRRIIKEYAE